MYISALTEATVYEALHLDIVAHLARDDQVLYRQYMCPHTAYICVLIALHLDIVAFLARDDEVFLGSGAEGV